MSAIFSFAPTDLLKYVRNYQTVRMLRVAWAHNLLKHRVHRPNGLLRTAAILQATLKQ